MITDLKLASEKRNEDILFSELDNRIDLLLSNYQKVTANPRSMGYLRFLLRHYGRMAHPWRACFTADTPIDCPRDHERYPYGIPISQLQVGQHVWSYSEKLETFELKPITNIGIAKRESKIYALTLDSGARIRATSDHKFLKKSGEWVQLKDLKEGDSLVPLYRDFTPRIKVRPFSISTWKDEHKEIVNQLYGDKRIGLQAHHIDERYCNTSTDNFELLTGSEHRKRHKSTIQEKFEKLQITWQCKQCESDFRPTNGAQIYCKSCQDVKHGSMNRPYKCKECGDEFMKDQRRQIYCVKCQDIRNYKKTVVGTTKKCDNCPSEFKVMSATQKYCSSKCREARRSPHRKGSGNKPYPCKQCGTEFIREANNQRYCVVCSIERKNKLVVRLCLNCGDEFQARTNQKFCDDVCRQHYKPITTEMALYNHKVVSVKELAETEDVWDMEVADNHNFVVHGVVAHNCYKDNLKRFGDKTPALCGVLKDAARQTTYWRGKAGHSKVPDVGDPGYAIGEADKGAAPPWGGHRHLAEESSDLDMGDMAMPDEVALILEDLGSKCDVYRVLVGLDEPPHSDMVIL